MIDKLKDIICKCSSEDDAVNQLKDELLKQDIIDALEDDALGISLDDLGLTLDDINDNKYMYNISDEEHGEQFANTDLTNLYRYVAHTSSGYGSDNIGKNSRSFCKQLAKRTNTSLMRYVDILKITPNKGFGQGGSNIYSVFKFRGGVNCKHIWVKYVYNKKTKKLVEAPKSEQPKQIGAGSVPNA